MNENRREQGQVLVLIILAIVGIMGFLALAVDGGRFYAERRRAQSAADAAAYTAAMSAQMGLNWESKATEQLVMNGYGDTDIIDNSLPVDVMIYNPPLDAAVPGRYPVPHEYFQVIIRTKVDPVFAQFVYNGPFSMTVEAITRATYYKSTMVGKAIFSTGPSSCNAIKLHTSSNKTTKIDGGGIYAHSNACSGNCKAIGSEGGANTVVTNGSISTPGCIDYGSGDLLADQGTTPSIPQVPITMYQDPDCTGLPSRTFDKNATVLEPGNYTNQIKITGSTSTSVRFNSGMYCLPDGLNVNGGQLLGDGVMFVIQGGNVEIGGNTIVHLNAVTAPALLEDAKKRTWNNMLFYMPYDNDGIISLSGGGNSHFTGTVYAPGPAASSKPKCQIIGNSDAMALNSALICYDLDIGGTANVNIIYRPNQNYNPDPEMNLNK